MTTETNKPVEKIKIGPLSAAIWKTDTKNGPLYNVTLDRTYFQNEEFIRTGSFRERDLLTLAKLVDFAHTAIHQMAFEETEEASDDTAS